MTSTVTSKGQTVVPKALRERFNIKPGATLDWQEDGQSLRVIKLEPPKTRSFLEDLRRLGRVHPGPRADDAQHPDVAGGGSEEADLRLRRGIATTRLR